MDHRRKEYPFMSIAISVIWDRHNLPLLLSSIDPSPTQLVPCCPFHLRIHYLTASFSSSYLLYVHFLAAFCGLDDQKVVALCKGLQTCPSIEALSLGE
jgi:hypothetical protein